MIMYINRHTYLNRIQNAFEVNNIVALLGPRQCGKTTLALDFAKTQDDQITHFDLEDPDHLSALSEPKLNLLPLSGLVIIDEIQRMPDLFPYLRVLSDTKSDLKIMILGSASQDLIRQSSESLAGRISYINVTPIQNQEFDDANTLWLRGGFPKSLLARTDQISFAWRKDYIKTFLERDIPSFGFAINPDLIRRFWTMIADCHGQMFNASELGRALDLDSKTVKRYLDILSMTFMTRKLSPWFANITKRQIKSPKIYLRDSGIFHYFTGIQDHNKLITSPKIGVSWEGFALEQIITTHEVDDQDCYFWGTPAGAELDLLIYTNLKLQAFEFKYTSRPKITKSMISALETLQLDHLSIIIPGDAQYKLSEQISVFGLTRYIQNHAKQP